MYKTKDGAGGGFFLLIFGILGVHLSNSWK